MPYNEDDEDITWEDCTLRAWLNDEFYHEAFTKTERSAILLTELENSDNFYYETEGGNDTEDHVFLLSLDEVMEYYDIDEDDFEDWTVGARTDPREELMVPYSPAALEEFRDIYINEYGYAEDEWEEFFTVLEEDHSNAAGEVCCWWWLRSPGYSQYGAAGVLSVGSVSNFGYVVNSGRGCVRPALWIDLES